MDKNDIIDTIKNVLDDDQWTGDRNERALAAKAAKNGAWARMQTLVKSAEREKRDLHASELREYNLLDAQLDQLGEIAAGYVDRAGVVAPSNGGRGDSYVANRPLTSSQTFLGATRAQGAIPEGEDDNLSVGKVIKAMVTGDWRGADRESAAIKNAMSGAGAGGILLPTTTSAQIIDLARAKTRVLEAGAQIVPMDARTVVVPRLTGDPTPAWRAENAAVAEVDAAMDGVTLSAKTLACIVRISRELVEDTDVEDVVRNSVAAAIAVKWDYAALYGAGTNEPTGVKNTSAVTKTPLATNGATPTWDNLVAAVGRLRDQNEEPTAQITNDRTLRSLAAIKDTTLQYVVPPTYLNGIPRLATNQVPINLTVGTSNDTADLFTADWTKLILGVRTGPLTIQLNERYADSGQIGLLCWFRGDIGIARAKAFDVATGVRP